MADTFMMVILFIIIAIGVVFLFGVIFNIVTLILASVYSTWFPSCQGLYRIVSKMVDICNGN